MKKLKFNAGDCIRVAHLSKSAFLGIHQFLENHSEVLYSTKKRKKMDFEYESLYFDGVNWSGTNHCKSNFLTFEEIKQRIEKPQSTNTQLNYEIY